MIENSLFNHKTAQVVVAGLGRFGSELARTLYQMGHEVMAIDIKEEAVQEMVGQVTYPVAGDAANEGVLRDLGVQDFDVGVVAIGTNVEASIMAAVLFKTMSLKYVAARAHSELHGNTLQRIGCDRVVHVEQETGTRVAHNLFNPDVREYMSIGPNFGISRIEVPKRLVGMALSDAGFTAARQKSGISVIAIKRADDVTLIPDPDEKLRQDDVLLLSGQDSQIQELAKED